jgi:hypothetical protein
MLSSSVRVAHPVDGVSGTTLYEALDPQGLPVAGRRLAVVARMHGNEPVGDPVLRRLEQEVGQHLVRGSILVVRANEEGALLDQRHTAGGVDMNRLWDPATQARMRERSAQGPLSYEEERALQLYPLLLACDAVLDLHSTSRPAAPFLVMRDDQAHATLALGLGVRRLITGVHENGILSGGVCANVGLPAGERGARIGFTFEAGQHTDPENGLRAWEVTVRYLAGLGVWEPVPEPTQVQAEVYEIIERFKQVGAGVEPYRFVGYDGGEPGGGRRGLPARRLHSFEEIQADEVILRRGRAEVVRAHIPFTMLMPAPATPPDTDLYYVAQPRQGGLTQGTARTDEEARREAVAIERMLDLLSDDEFERGSTWVGFDSRRLFDLCANLVGRTLRLEPGHPHRRVVVMGRGDTGGDEAERRAGHRYRDAMRHAIAQGLPMERIQLLRGAPLAWIDALTSRGMVELLTRRKAATQGAREDQMAGVGMRVSLRQPHTASVLVGGDLERALETGDTRHVRVAVLIEAATVEPDGGSARVRVVRSGIVSTRTEVLRAASNLLRTLREEHRYLVRHGALRSEPAISTLLREDDAFEAVPEHMEALRAALYRTQLRMWTDQLRPELTEPVELRTEAHVGIWLARTMTNTGILDADALRSLVIRPVSSGGYVAEPEALEQLSDKLARRLDVSSLGFAPPAPAAPSPPQPLFASEVSADDLERWVSWTRFVRGVQVVPDTRGKDLDLAFSGADIRDRLTRWWDTARQVAAERPGELLVVVAGDGLHPARDQMSEAFPLYRAHRAVILDPHLHYLRIQHAQGTHLSWMKDFLGTLQRRPPGAPSAALHFEVEHGATASVILVLERDRTVLEEPQVGSLDGWDMLACGVVLSDLESLGNEDYKVGLFTERRTTRSERSSLNLELAHFGRAHCEGLLSQMGVRARVENGPLATQGIEDALVGQIARWIERVRSWRTRSGNVPRDYDARAGWVATRLGIADARLARVLGREMDRDTPPLEAARALWASVPPWPGPTWHERADRDRWSADQSRSARSSTPGPPDEV